MIMFMIPSVDELHKYKLKRLLEDYSPEEINDYLEVLHTDLFSEYDCNLLEHEDWVMAGSYIYGVDTFTCAHVPKVMSSWILKTGTSTIPCEDSLEEIIDWQCRVQYMLFNRVVQYPSPEHILLKATEISVAEVEVKKKILLSWVRLGGIPFKSHEVNGHRV